MRCRKIVGLVAAVAIVCAMAWLLFSRWSVWFGNAPEPAYSTPNIPHHILLTLNDDDPHSRVLTWQCDTAKQMAVVEFFYNNDSTAGYDRLHRIEAVATKFVSQGGSSVFYRAVLPTPQEGKYSYRIAHNDAETPWQDFAVGCMSDSIVRFAFLGDIQDSINGITRDITRQIVQRHPDREFFLFGGDLIHRPQERYWDELFRGISPFAASHPVVAVSGNHEYNKGLYKVSEARFPLHFAYFDEVYNTEDFCFATLQYDHIELFLFDSHCDILRIAKQRRLLKEALAQSAATWKIVVLHHPPYSIRSSSNNLHLRWLLTPVLEQYAVDVVLSGHEHGYARIHPHKGYNNQVPIYTISHCSPKTYSHRNTDVEVYDNGAKYYQCIDCTSDTLLMRTYTSTGHTIDEVRLVKQKGKTIVL